MVFVKARQIRNSFHELHEAEVPLGEYIKVLLGETEGENFEAVKVPQGEAEGVTTEAVQVPLGEEEGEVQLGEQISSNRNLILSNLADNGVFAIIGGEGSRNYHRSYKRNG